jgi:hypothetical protein
VGQPCDVRATARAFISEAFEALAREHVIPTPVFHPYVAVGRDYYGDTIRVLDQYQAFEQALEAVYPGRFAEPRGRPHPEFATTHVFGFLEACIARCGLAADFDPQGEPVEESIEELLHVLAIDTYEMVCVRHVSHLTSATRNEIQLGDITVVPEPADWGGLTDRVQHEIIGAAQAWNRDDPRPYGPPHSLLIARETTADPDVEGVKQRLSARISRFLLLARLLTAGTAYTNYEIVGSTTRVARMRPQMSEFQGGLFGSMPIRRTAKLSEANASAFAKLGAALDAADVKREGMVATSFDVALSRLNRSYRSDSQYEHVVDLATALEAALIGSDKTKDEITLRLRTRAAALLATPADPAEAVFEDVGRLYDLRSKLVHGGQIKEAELAKFTKRISTMPADGVVHGSWVALGYTVDRMRDLVRRSILARVGLASQPGALWSLASDAGVDAALTDDAQRRTWREHWRQRLAELDAGSAVDPPRPAVDFLSQEDV